MSVNWGLGIPQTDPGTAFTQSYQNALLMGQQADERKFQRDQMVQQREVQREQMNVQGRERKLSDYHDVIRQGARIVRQIQPRDDATWQNVRAAAQTAGIDLTDVPEHYDPNYVQQLLAAGQSLETQQQQDMPNIQREVQYYRSIGRDDLAQQLLTNHAEGAPVVFDVNHDGAPDLVPRSYFNNQGGQQPAPQGDPDVVVNPQTGQMLRFNPQSNAWEPAGANPTSSNTAPDWPVPGGAASVPRNFP